MQEIQDDGPEVRAGVKVHVTALYEGIIERLESLISDWARMKRVVALDTKVQEDPYLKDKASAISLYN